MKVLLFLGLSAAFLASCGKKEAPASAPASTTAVFTVPSKDLSESQRLAKNAVALCENNENCSPSVGLASYAANDSAGVCTFFLVGKKLVATNGHCVPKDLKQPGSFCGDRIWFTFAPDVNNPTHQDKFSCEKVIYTSAPGAEDDLAILSLSEESSRPILKISRDGLEDQSVYRFIRMSPTRVLENIGGVQSTVSCKSYFHSIFVTNSFHGKGPTGIFSDCKLQLGNSGTPVINADGRVAAIFYGFLNEKEYEKLLKNLLETGKFRKQEQISPINFATNFACLTGLPNELNLPDPNCKDSSEMENEHLNNSQKELFMNLEKEIRDFVLSAPKYFQWKENTTENQHTMVEPSCVRLQDLRDLKKDKSGVVVFSVQRPVWSLGYDIDSFSRPVFFWKKEMQPQEKVTVKKLDPKNYSVLFTGTKTQSFSIPVCSTRMPLIGSQN